MANLKVCWHCLLAIESREGPQVTVRHGIDAEDIDAKCDWCQEAAEAAGFDELYELI